MGKRLRGTGWLCLLVWQQFGGDVSHGYPAEEQSLEALSSQLQCHKGDLKYGRIHGTTPQRKVSATE